jgi:hypothetical protein
LVTFDAALGDPVHLKRHQPGIHLLEQPFPDPKDDIWSENGVVNRQNQRRPDLRNTEVPVAVLFGSHRQKATTLRNRQNLRAPVVDPHDFMIDGCLVVHKGQKSTPSAVKDPRR